MWPSRRISQVPARRPRSRRSSTTISAATSSTGGAAIEHAPVEAASERPLTSSPPRATIGAMVGGAGVLRADARGFVARAVGVLGAAVLLLSAAEPSSAEAPAGEATVSFHVTIAPTWLDPATAPPQITPFGLLYALHDALVRPLPGQKMAPSL